MRHRWCLARLEEEHRHLNETFHRKESKEVEHATREHSNEAFKGEGAAWQHLIILWVTCHGIFRNEMSARKQHRIQAYLAS